jgi:multiple sugar transport system permease protein
LNDSLFLFWLLNSCIVAWASTTGYLAISSLAAYAFAKLKFPGRDVLFVVVIASLMIPSQVIIVPLYLLIADINLTNNLLSLIMPRFALPIGVFMLRQFFLGVPMGFEDAARIDGCNRFGVYFRVILPLSRPALATLAIFFFVWTWNEFLWPLIAMTKEINFTLPVGIANFHGTQTQEYGRFLAAAVLASLPTFGVFLVFQRHFVKGAILTGLKA